MTWTVQRQQRSKGWYYSALWRAEPRRSVTLGVLVGAPETAAVLARLRAHDPEGKLPDAVIVDLVKAADDDAARAVLRTHRHFAEVDSSLGTRRDPASDAVKTRKTPDGEPDRVKGPVEVRLVGAQGRKPRDPKGAITLRRYYEEVWTPIRSEQASTFDRESWWWEKRILPALGDVHLADLDTDKWRAFMGTLDVGGRSKAICQTAYRTALRHAVEELRWLDGMHHFAKIKGSTKATHAKAEPLRLEEVDAFLGGAPTPMHRAMFGLQLGNGLRPGEVLAVRWEDIRFDRGSLHVRGTKNARADAVVALLPISRREMHAWWVACGEPTSGPCFTRTRGKEVGVPFDKYPRSAFRSTAAKSGLNGGRVRKLFPNVMRHSFASIAALGGIDRAHTKDLMRHTRASSVMDEAYVHAEMEATARAFERLFEGPAGEE